MKLDLGTFTLRTFRDADAPSIARHANNRNVSRNLRDAFPFPYRLEDAHGFIAKFNAPEQRGLVLAIEVEGAAVGAIGVHPLDDVYRRSAELGYWLGEPFWGRGIATLAVRAITEQAFLRQAELVRIHAAVFGWNPASGRVLEKAGFVREGVLRQSVFKDGVLADSFMYARLR
jgi:ribosomal-protein-alanine N-acetyltransferase